MGLLNIANDHDVTVLDLNLSALNKNEAIAVQGRYLYYQSGVTDIKIKFNSPSNDAITIPRGSEIRLPSGFDKIFIESSGTGKITLLIFSDDNAKVSIPPPSSQNSSQSDFNLAYTVNTVATKIWNASYSLKEGAIANNSNTETIYLGSSSVTVNNGFPVYPQTFLSLSSFVGDVYALTSSNTADVRVMRVI